MFDPNQIGWTEFWLRVAVAVLSLLALALVLMVVAKVLLTLFDLACWLLGKRRKKGESEMDEGAARRALLTLVPKGSRERADRLLRVLSATRQEAPSGPVYVSEYDGYPPRVHGDVMAAQVACVAYLRSEGGEESPWDWFPDSEGWVMRYVDPGTDTPGLPLNGRVTQAEVEA